PRTDTVRRIGRRRIAGIAKTPRRDGRKSDKNNRIELSRMVNPIPGAARTPGKPEIGRPATVRCGGAPGSKGSLASCAGCRPTNETKKRGQVRPPRISRNPKNVHDMNTETFPWADELDCATTVCDREGVVLYQN